MRKETYGRDACATTRLPGRTLVARADPLPRRLFGIIPNIDFPRSGRLPCARPMNPVENKKFERELGERLATSGFRFTSQRRHVYDVLLRKLDHPTAEDVFTRVRRRMPDISRMEAAST